MERFECNDVGGMKGFVGCKIGKEYEIPAAPAEVLMEGIEGNQLDSKSMQRYQSGVELTMGHISDTGTQMHLIGY